MKYFDENMTCSQSRGRYFYLMIDSDLSDKEKEEVQEEYKLMISINANQLMENAQKGELAFID